MTCQSHIRGVSRWSEGVWMVSPWVSSGCSGLQQYETCTYSIPLSVPLTMYLSVWLYVTIKDSSSTCRQTESGSCIRVILSSPVWLSFSCFSTKHIAQQKCRACGRMKTVQLGLFSANKKKKKRLQKRRNAYNQCFSTLLPEISQGWLTQDSVILAVFSPLKLLCGGFWYH